MPPASTSLTHRSEPIALEDYHYNRTLILVPPEALFLLGSKETNYKVTLPTHRFLLAAILYAATTATQLPSTLGLPTNTEKSKTLGSYASERRRYFTRSSTVFSRGSRGYGPTSSVASRGFG